MQKQRKALKNTIYKKGLSYLQANKLRFKKYPFIPLSELDKIIGELEAEYKAKYEKILKA